MDKDMVHIYNGILLSHQKGIIRSFIETWMDQETEWSKSERETDIYYLIYVESGKAVQVIYSL